MTGPGRMEPWRRLDGRLALAMAILALATAALADPPPEAATMPPQASSEAATPIQELELATRVREMLDVLHTHHPSLAAGFDKDQEERLLRTLSAIFPGVEYLPAGAAPEALPEPPRNGGPYPGIIVAAQKALYVRLDDFRRDTIRQAREDIAGAARLTRPPVGVVLDLRNARGEDYAGATRLLHLFHGGKADAADGKDASVRLPAIVLVGRDTAGAAEVFATLIERAGNALTMGQRTAGRPFPRKKVLLRNGDLLLIPDIPPPLRTVAPVPVKPSVAAQAGPQVDYARLAETVDGDQQDACLQRAVDLLLSLHALRQRGAK